MSNNKSPNPINTPNLDAGTPEISMAPLIDVVFLLLIFFMVTTVFPENRGLIIEKPESSSSEPLAMKKIVFQVSSKGEIRFKNKPILISDIKRLVREQLNTAPDTAVLLQVDKNATTDVFIKALDACKAGGAKQVGIATNAIDEKP
ncbi:MAG: biopolymer transporter ExbD [Gammaproteobacteria bacterium]|nr:biopolymer transporter ExbD [Gammaproteobacteria bacterium]